VKATYSATSDCVKPSFHIPGIDGHFDALQFHIHTKSEHLLQGQGYDAEIHVVHKKRGDDGELAVVGIFFEGSAYEELPGFNKLIDEWWDVSCLSEDCPTTLSSSARRLDGHFVNPYNWIPKNTQFYKYFGGLTTPPCTEIVNWNVAKTPAEISFYQLMHLATMIIGSNGKTPGGECKPGHSIADVIGSTSRQVQEILERKIELVCEDFDILSASEAAEKTGSSDSASFTLNVITASFVASGVILPVLNML